MIYNQRVFQEYVNKMKNMRFPISSKHSFFLYHKTYPIAILTTPFCQPLLAILPAYVCVAKNKLISGLLQEIVYQRSSKV